MAPIKKTIINDKKKEANKKTIGSKVVGNTMPQPSNIGTKIKVTKKIAKNTERKSAAKCWCFTLFPEIKDEEKGEFLENLKKKDFKDNDGLDFGKLKVFENCTNIQFFIYQLELCPTSNRIHYQGYFQLKKKERLSYLKKNISDRAKFILANGTAEDSIIYCSKDKTKLKGPWSGGRPKNKGQRTDFEELAQYILDGGEITDDIKKSLLFGRHYKYFQDLILKTKLKNENLILQEKMKNFNPTKIQLLIRDLLEKQHKRQVLWIYDENGNKGKSEFCHWLKSLDTNNVFLTTNCKHADMMHMYNNQRTILFDYTRAQEEQINYTSIEQFKSGNIIKTKYESSNYIIKDNIKVAIFANFMPDIKKLSKDRWFIVKFDKNNNMIIDDYNNDDNNKVTEIWNKTNKKSKDKLKKLGIFEKYFDGNESDLESDYEEEYDPEMIIDFDD